jgi:hypothetical protein
MAHKYHDETGKNIGAYIWFKCLGKGDKLIQDYPNAACYGAITNQIPKGTETICVYREMKMVPYSDESISRYTYDLNDMGFPCSVGEGKAGYIYINVRTEDYKSKTHLFSTLTLLRLLWESGMNKVPEIYFQLMDEDPARDKLDAIQRAHKTKGIYTNGGHCVTFNGNGGNIDKETLFARFDKSNGVFASGWGRGINAAWHGLDPTPCVNSCRDCLWKRANGVYL